MGLSCGCVTVMEAGEDYLLQHSLDLRVNSYTYRDTEPGYKVGLVGGDTTAV